MAGHYSRRRRREFLHFMNRVVAAHPGREIHVSWITSTPTSPSTTAGWPCTRTSTSTTLQPAPPGSTKWKSGSASSQPKHWPG
jgi:hypothetical protein